MKKSSRINIPRGCWTNYIQGMSQVGKEIHKDYINCYQANPFGDDTLETGERLMKAVSEARRNKCQELIESTNVTRSSRKTWKTIKMLGNNYTITQTRYEVISDQVAHQLLLNSRKNPGQLNFQNLLKVTRTTFSFTKPFTTVNTYLASKW